MDFAKLALAIRVKRNGRRAIAPLQSSRRIIARQRSLTFSPTVTLCPVQFASTEETGYGRLVREAVQSKRPTSLFLKRKLLIVIQVFMEDGRLHVSLRFM